MFNWCLGGCTRPKVHSVRRGVGPSQKKVILATRYQKLGLAVSGCSSHTTVVVNIATVEVY